MFYHTTWGSKHIQAGYSNSNNPQHAFKSTLSKALDLKSALSKYASDAVIFLSPGDYGYREMALNLYKTSYERLNLTNHLFVALDDKLCGYLTKHGANCAQYLAAGIENPTTASDHGSEDFKRKVYTKADIVMLALKLHISVVLVDADIVFLKNPLPYMTCSDCDLVIGPNGRRLCAGFYRINPTPNSEQLLRGMSARFNTSHPTVLEQPTFNIVLEEMKERNDIKYKVLNENIFHRGRTFFKLSGRIFKGDQPCEQCVMVHNNYIVGLANKIYRFKEYGFWEVDTNGYYTSPERKYIIYANHVSGHNNTMIRHQEDKALWTAFTIGYLLNRTVILPKFHLQGSNQSLMTFYDIEQLDSGFKNCYRESTFLESDLVPDKIKSSVSETILIQSGIDDSQDSISQRDVHILKAATSVITVAEIMTWFSGNKLSEVSVLKFHSLYFAIERDERTNHISNQLENYLKFY